MDNHISDPCIENMVNECYLVIAKDADSVVIAEVKWSSWHKMLADITLQKFVQQVIPVFVKHPVDDRYVTVFMGIDFPSQVFEYSEIVRNYLLDQTANNN